MIACAVAVLPSLGLDTSVLVSADDPMGREPSQLTGVVVRAGTKEWVLDPLQPHESRRVNLTDLVKPERDQLVFVERHPIYGVQDESMWRTVVRYHPTGQSFYGEVLYELPPKMNAKPGSTTYTETAVLLGQDHRAWLVLLHVTPRDKPVTYSVGDTTCDIPPNGVGVMRLYGVGMRRVVGFCPDAALIVLVLQEHIPTGMVTVEHTNPYQGLWLTREPWQAKAIKAEAIRSCSRR